MIDEQHCPCCGALITKGRGEQFYTDPYDILLAKYYRSRALQIRKRTTLRQIAKDAGVPYSTLTKRKMEYDRAGKWGAKHKATP